MTEVATTKQAQKQKPDLNVDIYAGSATPLLAQSVVELLGLSLGHRDIHHFEDGETHVQILDNARGRDIYIIQSTCWPVNENLMELLIMIDAFRRASADRITAIIPYYGYARQEKKSTGREPITAKLVANLLTVAGADRVVAIDLHSPAIQGFFDIGMISLTAIPLLADYVRKNIPLQDAVIVTPDTGRLKVADMYANLLNLPLVVVYKRRSGEHGEEVEARAIIGDVKGKHPIIVDDIISTGGTIVASAEALLEAGAQPDMTAVATHGVLAPVAEEKLARPEIKRIVTTDTIPLHSAGLLDKTSVISVAGLLAETISRLHLGQSISALFRHGHETYPV
ncbi:MAG TPA: ribose-phosphate pyrophosphokinase [Ktedonobacteraceae bacterium]|nr:ribose-phosphate pyrophosphokinase [Ktedonobacteraceae bacterium]